jgi:DNA-binding SARP family transcriptional activator/tetratricopeptide (TPR) repeat protein
VLKSTQMQAEFRLLGPLEVLVDGRELELRRPMQRSLLALLLLRAGEVVSTDRLVEELWAGQPPKTAVGSLQNLVSELRKALGPDAVKTRAPGYVLAIEPARVDFHRFERLVAQVADTENAERRADLLRQALALWRGPPLADLAFEPFAQVAIARLEELRTAAREELVDAELELGRHAALVGELEALVLEHPLRERPRGQLMLALYRSGRQAEALEAYRTARETLVDELGIDPSPELQKLEQAMLRHDPQLDLRGRVASAPTEPDRRKMVTLLFTDVVDSTSLSATLDPEVMRAVMKRYFDTVRTIVERHGGTVEKFIGDAAMAAFGIPELHEDDALRAVRAAEELHEAVAALNDDLGRDHGLAIQIRSAITTGEVIAGDTATGEAFATGTALNVARRLHQSALPDEILLGTETETLVREAVATEPVEPVDLGAALGRVPAFRFVALQHVPGGRPRHRARLIGRADELARLKAEFERVRDERQSRVFTVLGEAGVGKSRLAAELGATLGTNARTLTGRCVSYGEGATYLPLAEIVRQAVPKRPQAAVAALLAGSEDAEVVAQRVAEVAGLAHGVASTGEVFWAIRRFLEGLAAERPLMLVLEDIHWAEPTLLDFIEYMQAWISGAPILVLCLARPELLEQRPGWAGPDAFLLERLSANDTATLVEELAGEEGLDDHTRARIVEIAEGNALFVEQLHAYVTGDVGPEGLETVPPTIEALLASRLDRLDPDERAVIDRAAVIGKEFRRSAVLHLSPPRELAGIDTRLQTLVQKGLLHASRPTALDEEPLRFNHVLIRDVAYAGITKEARADLHERHAAWLEHRSDPEELIGYHVEQAHRYRRELRPADPDLVRLANWAGERLSAAGIRASKRADIAASINLLARSANLLSTDRGEVLCELGIAQRWAGEFEQAEQTLREAVESAARDRRVELRARIELAQVRLTRDPEHSSAELLSLAAKATPVFEELGDDLALGRTWREVGYIHAMQGQLAAWQVAAEKALAHYRRSGWSTAGCLAGIAAALFYGPTPVPEAIERCRELLDEAPDRAGKANVSAFLGGLSALNGDIEEARRLLAEATATYEELGDTYGLANNSWRVLGRIELLAGEAAEAERILRDSCATFERIDDRPSFSTLAAEVADTLYVQGRYEEATTWVGLAEEGARSDDVSAQFTWRRVRAKLNARAGALDEAQTLALEAAGIAARTDDLDGHGAVLLDVAEVWRLSERAGDAARSVEQALVLFERKQNRLSAATARARLSELAVA